MDTSRSYAIYEIGAMAQALEDTGYAFVPQALSTEQCAAARTRIDRLTPIGWDEAHDPHDLARTRFLDRYLCVFNRDTYWLPFTDRPGFIDLAEAVLGANCHLIGLTAWRSHPGYKAESLHVDYLPFGQTGSRLTASFAVPIFVLSVHFYLSQVTPDLAPTRIVPGSHRALRAPRESESTWEGASAVSFLAAAGDALVFRSDVWHAGSDNRSADEVRYLLQVHYGRRQVAQHFSPFMTWRFNPEVIAAASARQRRLLGDHEPGAYD